MKPLDIVLLLLGAGLSVISLLLRNKEKMKLKDIASPDKAQKKAMKRWTIISFASGWLLIVQLLSLVFSGAPTRAFDVEITAPHWHLFGFSISSTIVITWAIMLFLLCFSLVVRFVFLPRFREIPGKFQNILESAVEGISNYTDARVHGLGASLGAYIFALAAFMICCAAVELFGFRAPTADLTMTFAMALITFVLINYYGIKVKGFGGRIKSMAYPTPVVFPFKVISDIATPVSLACRLFGNMLGGMIVMDLLYTAMGTGAIGVPSALGLYFNLFHPLIQTFIFVTLSLTFISEAVEEAE